MIKGTTPTFVLTVSDPTVDLEAADHVYFTIVRGATIITKQDTDLELDGNVCSCWLSQAEALTLSVGKAEIQLNWTFTDDGGTTHRAATVIKTINIGEQLLDEAVS